MSFSVYDTKVTKKSFNTTNFISLVTKFFSLLHSVLLGSTCSGSLVLALGGVETVSDRDAIGSH
jgi:hypothetical protein